MAMWRTLRALFLEHVIRVFKNVGWASGALQLSIACSWDAFSSSPRV